ncbi:2-hydroxy-3-keto-5-methylthiopentenyl-1-phosphate phosphatase [Rossellomorea vietnamensis]|uniref:2-hydroxy-3-keto-5-methylthiopentenyl-1- phosphate phosphatase n=1 Tax=Rossellomorea vietnamensis TaxID=218284 RepID=UPI001E3EB5D6|nr:2-hydroxy-3-keto-5-methylthiopentenyl-1-phosphate phosphatase [Rossellomorea vietnamensis]MCC5802542.1 2-hydroxy-3-keto-5-methylthiopentenyl-1-phosphate phosphatase [Rossellomorea vietnamensis]
MSLPVIFCDFDGTITETDNIISLMKAFAPPEWEPVKEDILSQSISIKEGVSKLFSLIPSSKKDEMIQYLMETAVIREGFKEFVDYTKVNEIPLYIVSGGIDFFVHPLLKEFGPFKAVYCNEAIFNDSNITIHWPYTCDVHCENKGCGCCKPSILRALSLEDHEVIVIGDSVTDIEMAKLGDTVLARDYLARTCEEKEIPYHPFETFHDCIKVIEKGVTI